VCGQTGSCVGDTNFCDTFQICVCATFSDGVVVASQVCSSNQTCDQSYISGCVCVDNSACGPLCDVCSGAGLCFNSTCCCDPSLADQCGGMGCQCGDQLGGCRSPQRCYNATCLSNVIAIDCKSLTAQVSQPYTSDLGISGCFSSCVSIDVAGAPSGLFFNGSALVGTPDTVGAQTFTVTVLDTAGFIFTDTCTLIVEPPRLSLDCSVPLQMLVNTSGAVPIPASGGVTPLSFSGFPPSGLAVTTDGYLSGSPVDLGLMTFTVIVADSTQNVVGVCSVEVTIAPVIACPSQSYGDIGIP
jgi:hypothetical protein